MKIFWFDVETTGLQPWKHDIVQLACMVEIDNVVKEEHSWFIRPFDEAAMDPKALAVNNLTPEQVAKFPEPTTVFNQDLIPLLSRHVDKFDKNDKLCPAGFNVDFDIDFLQQFFKKNGDKWYGSWFNYDAIDPLQHLRFMQPVNEKVQEMPNKKLITACQMYGVPLGDDAHEAMADIRATRTLTQKMWGDLIF